MHRDSLLFEFLVLEGAQAGLSWLTILRKRENYRRAFDNFDPARVALYTEARIQKLKQDGGIIRNELKIRSAIQNAKSVLVAKEEYGSFDKYIWSFAPSKKTARSALKDIPAKTAESDAMSKGLQKKGFSFVGSTICYSFMQATGMVNDHLDTCFRVNEV